MTINKTTLFLLATLVLFFTACSSKEKKVADKIESKIGVDVATPLANSQQGIYASGQVEAAQTANISTRIMGFITMLNVKVGDRVSKGQLLVSISNQDILAKRAQADAMIAEAQATLKSAQKDYDRFTALYKQQSATAKELDNVTLQYSATKARLELARQMRNEVNASLNYTALTAPFSGIVTQKMAEEGGIANPGMSLLTIEQSGSYQVSASVSENMIKQIHQGTDAIVNIKAMNKSFNGKVTQINQSSQFTGGQYIIKIGIPDKEKPGLYAGMYANVSIPSKDTVTLKLNESTILIPVTAIEHRDQLTGLYTISSNNTALLRWVRLGKTYGENVEVLSGLEKNEPYIIRADSKLYNGAPVKIK